MAPKTGGRKGEGPVPRRRRSAEEARREILDAAEKRLAAGGPEAVRLQDIARDVGISHPAILHHFGSRDGLTEALAERAIAALDRDLLRAFQIPDTEEPDAGGSVLDVIEKVFATLGDSGHARLLAWRALLSDERQPEAAEQRMLRHVTEALHARRIELARERGAAPPDPEDTFFVVRLAATALLGDAVAGDIIDLSVDAAQRADLRARFRAWLVRVLALHVGLEIERETSAAPPRQS